MCDGEGIGTVLDDVNVTVVRACGAFTQVTVHWVAYARATDRKHGQTRSDSLPRIREAVTGWSVEFGCTDVLAVDANQGESDDE